jgi:hypothetical protein
VSLLGALERPTRKVLILTDGAKPNVFLSGRNIQGVHVMPYADVSTYHILWSDLVLVESNALGYQLDTIEEQPRESRPKAEKTSRGAEKAEAKTARRATKSASAQKAARKGAKAAGKSAKPKAAAKSSKKTSAKKSAGKKKGK